MVCCVPDANSSFPVEIFSWSRTGNGGEATPNAQRPTPNAQRPTPNGTGHWLHLGLIAEALKVLRHRSAAFYS
jgi:hypothetical protein